MNYFEVAVGDEQEGMGMIRIASGGEFLECSCGNDVMASGFYPVNAQGEEVEPIAYSSDSDEVRHSWDGKLWKCGKCGMVEEMAR